MPDGVKMNMQLWFIITGSALPAEFLAVSSVFWMALLPLIAGGMVVIISFYPEHRQ